MLHCNTSFLNLSFIKCQLFWEMFAKWNVVPPWRRESGGDHCRGGFADSGGGGGVVGFSSTHLPSCLPCGFLSRDTDFLLLLFFFFLSLRRHEAPPPWLIPFYPHCIQRSLRWRRCQSIGRMTASVCTEDCLRVGELWGGEDKPYFIMGWINRSQSCAAFGVPFNISLSMIPTEVLTAQQPAAVKHTSCS